MTISICDKIINSPGWGKLNGLAANFRVQMRNFVSSSKLTPRQFSCQSGSERGNAEDNKHLWVRVRRRACVTASEREPSTRHRGVPLSSSAHGAAALSAAFLTRDNSENQQPGSLFLNTSASLRVRWRDLTANSSRLLRPFRRAPSRRNSVSDAQRVQEAHL